MWNNRLVSKHSNYNTYIEDISRSVAVEHDRLLQVINDLRDKFEDPYLRFMFASNITDDAACILYDGRERITRLVSLSAIEWMIENDDFTN